MHPQRVVVMGQGYVGLPLALRAAQVGHQVVGFETDSQRLAQLRNGCSYVENVADSDLIRVLEVGRYQPSAAADDLTEFDVAVICVSTPLSNGTPDLSCVEQATEMIAQALRPGCGVILESTTYPGTTEDVVVPILERGSLLRAGEDFWVGYSPERIDPGNQQWHLVNTPKLVAGIDAGSLKQVQAFYHDLVDHTVAVASIREAELAKLLENTFRHVNIALVNELAMFAHDLSIDIWAVIEAAATKPFGFMRFTPGPGVGGHCLPIDPSYLSWQVRHSLGQQFRFVELANDINDHMPDYVTQRVLLGLNRLGLAASRSRVLLLGLAYKRNSNDARESPAVMVARRLVALGAAVRAADPHVEESFVLDGVMRVSLTAEEVEAADAIILLTDHDDFDLAMVTALATYVFDTRHVLFGENIEPL